jgi:hypothetical protein
MNFFLDDLDLPLLDEDGKVLTARFIDMKKLLACSTRQEAENLLSM